MTPLDLGAFSVSLAVRDLSASQTFYENLGFKQIGGDPAQNFVILKSHQHVIGLFQGMFEGNVLTFNPGWDQSGAPVEPFTDIRELHGELVARGLLSNSEISPEGPASFMLSDPDGNQILIDQHR